MPDSFDSFGRALERRLSDPRNIPKLCGFAATFLRDRSRQTSDPSLLKVVRILMAAGHELGERIPGSVEAEVGIDYPTLFERLDVEDP
jgi:hypothetical protein